MFLASVFAMYVHKVGFIDNRKHWVDILKIKGDKLMLDFPNWKQARFDSIGVKTGNEI